MSGHNINKFLHAVGERRFDDVRAMLAPKPDLRWIMPARTGEQTATDEVVDRFPTWFERLTQINVVSTCTDTVGGRFLFAHPISGANAGWRTVHQQGVLDANDKGIIAIDVVVPVFWLSDGYSGRVTAKWRQSGGPAGIWPGGPIQTGREHDMTARERFANARPGKLTLNAKHARRQPWQKHRH